MPFYNFEDGLVPSGWTKSSGATKSWVITTFDIYAGTYSLRSDTITHLQSAAIECTINCGAGNVTFYLDVESENNYDWFAFYIDGTQSFRVSGDTGWQAKSVAVTAGIHVFKWEYSKDGSQSSGRDLAAIDNLSIPTASTSITIPATDLVLTAIAPVSNPLLMPASALDLITQAPFVLPILVPVAELLLSALAPGIDQKARLPNANLSLTAEPPAFWGALVLDNSSLSLTVQTPLLTLMPPATTPFRNIYRAFLTGSDETPPLADLELLISSFQSTRRNGELTYLSIVVPNPVPYIDSIQARLNGDLVIKSGFVIGNTENLTELIRVNFESLRYDLGPTSGSATLTGHKQVTYTNPKTVVLAGISYFSVTDGIRRLRCEPSMWLMPGDFADCGERGVFAIDSISYTVNPTSSTMEIAEVES